VLEVSAVRQLKESSARDVSIGRPTLAAQAFRAGLVDECHLFVVPVIVGGGKRGLPSDAFMMLELVEERRLGNVVCLGYRTCTGDRDRRSGRADE
jgi:riboflavin biosynthesis pyrimidine reductase